MQFLIWRLALGHGLAHEAVVGVAVFDGEADVGRVHGQRHAAAGRFFRLVFRPQRLPLVERLAARAAPQVVARAVGLQSAHPHLGAAAAYACISIIQLPSMRLVPFADQP
jgi:hypothetical protein